MNAPIITTPAGDLLANIHELAWLDVGEGEVDYVFNAMTLKAAQEGAAQIDLCPN